MEVKGCTLEEDGLALFPDAPTQRGVKHLRELAACREAGHQVVFCFAGGVGAPLQIHGAAGEEQFPAAPGVFHVDGLHRAVQLHLGNEAIGPGQKPGGMDVVIDHFSSSASPEGASWGTSTGRERTFHVKRPFCERALWRSRAAPWRGLGDGPGQQGVYVLLGHGLTPHSLTGTGPVMVRESGAAAHSTWKLNAANFSSIG